MNKYRVDRSDTPRTPCGMNSIVYLGDSWLYAEAMYKNTATGLDTWDKPNPKFGVVLSVWDEKAQDHKVLMTKGLAPQPAKE